MTCSALQDNTAIQTQLQEVETKLQAALKNEAELSQQVTSLQELLKTSEEKLKKSAAEEEGWVQASYASESSRKQTEAKLRETKEKLAHAEKDIQEKLLQAGAAEASLDEKQQTRMKAWHDT